MKSNIYLIFILILIILICSCLTNIKIKNITEEYLNDANYFLHNDYIQRMTISDIRTKINQNTSNINTIINNRNDTNRIIQKIERQNTLLRQRLQQLIDIAENI
tara:strand:+ start:65 stop:376 length:312 start_codon:yes stop_codon:yes gene_type:complete